MSSPALLNPDDPWFAFDHAMAHRNALGVMAPLTRFSVVPYFIEPFTAKRSADSWLQNHQQAHDDLRDNMPLVYRGKIVPGTGVGVNLIDSNLDNQWARSWLTFSNHVEHYVSDNATLPNPQTPPSPPAPIFKYPFW